MWQCTKCHEKNEASFEICWNCTTPRDGLPEKTCDQLDLEKEANKPEDETVCTFCGNRMQIGYVGISEAGLDVGTGLGWGAGEVPQSRLFDEELLSAPSFFVTLRRAYRCVQCAAVVILLDQSVP